MVGVEEDSRFTESFQEPPSPLCQKGVGRSRVDLGGLGGSADEEGEVFEWEPVRSSRHPALDSDQDLANR